MTDWYYVQGGRRQGPVSAEFIADEMRRGRLTDRDLAWSDPMPRWEAIGELPALGEIAAQAPPPLPSEIVAAATAALHPLLPGPAPVGLVSAPFHLRAGAMIIDQLIVSAPCLVVTYIVVSLVYANGAAFDINKHEDLDYAGNVLQLVAFPLFWIYYACFEWSRYQGTPGKIMLGLRVTNLEGARIAFWQAVLRFFVKNLTLAFGGFVFALYTPRRQALHDLVARTVVIVKQ